MPTDSREWTMTFEGKPIESFVGKSLDEELPEYLSDTRSYGRDEYEEFINKLKMRITELKSTVRYLEGKCEAQEKFWKIWNGESEE